MYLPPQLDVTFRRAQRLACPVAELRGLACDERVWRSALPWLAIDAFDVRPSGEIGIEGVVRRGPLRLSLHLEARLADEGDALALRLCGKLQHVIRFSGHAAAAPQGAGASLQCSLRIDGLPQSLHLVLAGAEHRALRAAAAAVEAFAAAPD